MENIMTERKSASPADDSVISYSCKEAARLMSESRDRALDRQEERSLNEHLAVCKNCVRFDSQLDFLSALAKRYAAGKTDS
jgi:Putative zinc-finger